MQLLQNLFIIRSSSGYVEEWNMFRQARRIAVLVLIASMVLPSAACKKKSKSSGKVVAENDPYFYSETAELVLQTDADKEVMFSSLSNVKVSGQQVIASYSINYIMPQEVLFEYEKVANETDEESIQKWSEISQEYDPSGIVVFDLQGNQVAKMTFPGSIGVQAVSSDSEGNLFCLVDRIPQGNTLYQIAPEGTILKEICLEDCTGYCKQLFMLENGESMLLSDDNIMKFDKEGHKIGELLHNLPTDSIAKLGEQYYLCTEDSSSVGKTSFVQEIDVHALKLSGNKQTVSSDMLRRVCNTNGACYVMNDNGIEKVDLLGNTKEKYLDWDSVDANYSDLSGCPFEVLSDDELILIGTKFRGSAETLIWGGRYFVTHLTRAEKNPHAGKPYIEIGTFGIPSSGFVDYINAYNQNENSPARVRLHNYLEDIDFHESEESEINRVSKQIYLDISSGEGPDILCNFYSFSKFNTDNVLVDLNAYIDGEKGFQREAYFDNVFRAFETNGKLFQIPVGIKLQGYLGNEQLIGERSGWTFEEFSQVAEAMPKNVMMHADIEYGDLLNELMQSNLNRFIDYESRTVSFEGEEFKQILQLTKQYGVAKLQEVNEKIPEYTSFGSEVYEITNETSLDIWEEMDLNDGILALSATSVTQLDDYTKKISNCDGQGIFVGGPTADGNGISALPQMSLAISQASSHKDEAWDFISHLFDEEAQYQYVSAMPAIVMNRNAFNRVNDDAIAASEKRCAIYFSLEECPPQDNPTIMKENRVKFETLVENVHAVALPDLSIMNVIQEEAAAFFADQQSLETVCKNIQERVTTIIQEK